MPPLLRDRTPAAQFVLLVVLPSSFGLLTGVMLGVSEPVYLVLSLLGILGGFGAGLEHDDPVDGLYRGLMGGLLFGVWILLAHGLFFDDAPKAELPDPAMLLVAITAVFGSGLGVLGARWRRARRATLRT